MKIRNGFVSNSSSSSFVIAYKKDYVDNNCKCPTCGSSINVIKLIKSLECNNGDTRIDAQGIDEVMEHHVDFDAMGKNFGYPTDKVYDDNLRKAIMAFLEGKNKDEYEITEVSISYCDYDVKETLLSDKNITIISRGE